MDVDRLILLEHRLKLRGGIPTSVSVFRRAGYPPVLRVVMSVPCTYSRKSTAIHQEDSIPLHLRDEDERMFYDWVLSRVEKAWRHELQEAFQVDGIRIFEPHPEQRIMVNVSFTMGGE